MQSEVYSSMSDLEKFLREHVVVVHVTETIDSQEKRGKVRRLTCCCCCGSSAGRWRQHWNRDTGYGVCFSCVASERTRGTSEQEILSLYGVEGVNWGKEK